MFDSISNEYDLINSIITFNSHKRWKREILKIAKKLNPKNALDIATGTADIAIQLGTLTNCKVIGIDISKKMLDIGRQKIKKNKLDHCIFLKTGDAEALSIVKGDLCGCPGNRTPDHNAPTSSLTFNCT